MPIQFLEDGHHREIEPTHRGDELKETVPVLPERDAQQEQEDAGDERNVRAANFGLLGQDKSHETRGTERAERTEYATNPVPRVAAHSDQTLTESQANNGGEG